MQAWLTSILVVIAGGGLLWETTDQGRALTAERARRIAATSGELTVRPFSLETMTGGYARVPGIRAVAIVEFIYTRCPTVCQSAGADMSRLRQRLTSAGLADRTSLYSVSFDPEVDTVERLAAYGERHRADGPLWTIARPDGNALHRILEEFGVIVLPDAFGGYTHNLALHVVAQDGTLVGIHDTGDFEAVIDSVQVALR